MSGEPTDPARADIPDGGRDIRTSLTIHPEEMQTLAYMNMENRDAIFYPLICWITFGEWNPPTEGRARSMFDALVRKHEEAVAKHRENKARQSERANKRWHKTSAKNAVAMPPQCRRNAVGMPTSTSTSTTTTTTTSTKTKKTESESESDTRTEKGVQGERTQTSESGSESVDISPGEIKKRVAATGRLKIDPWKMTGDDIRCGKLSAATILRLAFGDGGWRTAVEQAGEDAVLELFLTFRSGMRAGEKTMNPAAAFTARLQKDLGVDFTKTKQPGHGGDVERGSDLQPSASAAKATDPCIDFSSVLTNVSPQKTRRTPFAADRKREKTASIEQRKKEAWAGSDGELCREWCANARHNGCAAGIDTPPSANAERPHTPEECPRYKALQQETNDGRAA